VTTIFHIKHKKKQVIYQIANVFNLYYA